MYVPRAWGPDGRYELGDLLAIDSFGTVWRGLVRETQVPVAVRLAWSGIPAGPQLARDFAAEWAILATVRHPALLTVFDVVADGDRLGLVTDLVKGTDLSRHLASAGPISPATAISMAADLAEALATAHASGVAHTGVTAANVLVRGSDGRVLLGDLATPRVVRRLLDGAPSRAAHEAPAYAAPELIRDGYRGTAADVYALGIVLFEMLTGVAPYDGGSATDVLRRHVEAEPVWPIGLPSGLRYVLGRSLEHDPTGRPPAAAMAADLRELSVHVNGIPAAARPQPDTARYRLSDQSTGGHIEGAVALVTQAPQRKPRPDDSPSSRRHHETRLPSASARNAVTALVLVVLIAAGAIMMTSTLDDFYNGAETMLAQSNPAQPGPPLNAPSQQPTLIPSSTPALPAMGTRRTFEVAVAFLLYWFETLTHAVRTGDVTGLVDASSPQCAQCQAAATTIWKVYAMGGALRGGSYAVRSVTAIGLPAGGQATLDVDFDRSARLSVDADGRVRRDLRGARYNICRVRLEWSGEGWRVRSITSRKPVA